MKKILVSFVAVILVTTLFTSKVFALEIYYDNSTNPPIGYQLCWNYKSGTKMSITCSNDYFTGCASSYYSTGRSKWTTAASSYITLPDTSFSTAKCDFCTPTETWWNDRYGDPETTSQWGYVIFAATWISDTNGLLIDSLADAMASTLRIGSAAIYVNPHTDAWDGTHEEDGIPALTATQQKIVIAHELGHCMGIGHSDVGYYATTFSSIMKQNISNQATAPTNYDIAELQAHTPS